MVKRGQKLPYLFPVRGLLLQRVHRGTHKHGVLVLQLAGLLPDPALVLGHCELRPRLLLPDRRCRALLFPDPLLLPGECFTSRCRFEQRLQEPTRRDCDPPVIRRHRHLNRLRDSARGWAGLWAGVGSSHGVGSASTRAIARSCARLRGRARHSVFSGGAGGGIGHRRGYCRHRARFDHDAVQLGVRQPVADGEA